MKVATSNSVIKPFQTSVKIKVKYKFQFVKSRAIKVCEKRLQYPVIFTSDTWSITQIHHMCFVLQYSWSFNLIFSGLKAFYQKIWKDCVISNDWVSSWLDTVPSMSKFASTAILPYFYAILYPPVWNKQESKGWISWDTSDEVLERIISIFNHQRRGTQQPE